MRWGDSRGGSAWGRPLALPMWRRNIVQLCVACLLTVLLGGSLQLNKLAVLDGAGRQFSQSSYGSKTGFLVPFAVFKAICSLIVGSLADRHGRKRIAVLGWIVGLVAPLMVLSAPTDERGWTTVVSSAAFLGMQQGLVWTCMILVTLDLCGPTARGFASGLSETVGYTAIAVFAQIYGGFERRDVSCAWSPAASADASTSPEDPRARAAPRASPRSAARRRVATPRTIGTPRASARVSARDTPERRSSRNSRSRSSASPSPSSRFANRCGTPISARARETVASP